MHFLLFWKAMFHPLADLNKEHETSHRPSHKMNKLRPEREGKWICSVIFRWDALSVSSLKTGSRGWLIKCRYSPPKIKESWQLITHPWSDKSWSGAWPGSSGWGCRRYWRSWGQHSSSGGKLHPEAGSTDTGSGLQWRCHHYRIRRLLVICQERSR